MRNMEKIDRLPEDRHALRNMPFSSNVTHNEQRRRRGISYAHKPFVAAISTARSRWKAASLPVMVCRVSLAIPPKAWSGFRVFTLLATLMCCCQSLPALARSCATLKSLSMPNTAILSANVVSSTASLRSGGGDENSVNLSGLPEFCRVTLTLTPSADSAITVEVWMPSSKWNGKLRGIGNSGFGGSIEYGGMRAALSKGYAAVGTDSGHRGSPVDASWALGHPEKVIDFGYRSIHGMTVVAKRLIRAFYGKTVEYSYFIGCSGAGRQALMEVQRYPKDYNGVLAGAPAYNWTHLFVGGVWDLQAMQDEGSFIGPSQVNLVSSAVLKECGGRDGPIVGIVPQPEKCDFHPAILACRGPKDSGCLTPQQVDALHKIYGGPRTSTSHQIFPGYFPGGEMGPNGWIDWITGPSPGQNLQSLFAVGFFRFLVFANPQWDFRSFDFDREVEITDRKVGRILNATDPDLTAFRSQGGKLILYHGLSDPAIPATSTVDYYKEILTRNGSHATDSFARLYLVPGMQHCSGGPGPNSFGQSGDRSSCTAREPDIIQALERWVEHHEAPGAIVAHKHENDDPAQRVVFSRPLCPYPKAAEYRAPGDIANFSSYTCTGTY